MGGRVSFLPIQDGEGTPSPENVRPIRAPLYIDGIGEIYGGYVDIEAGTVVEERCSVIVDSTAPMRSYTPDQRNQGRSCGASYWLSTFGKAYARGYNPYSRDGYCDKLPYYENNYDYTSAVQTSNGITDIRLEGVRTKEEFLSWFEATGPIEIVYILRDPVVHSLTPAQLKSALDQLHYVPEPIIESRHRILMNTPHLVTPASSGLVTFNADMVAPLKECKVHFSPVQEGTGDPSPDNVRPISGWTGIRAGVRRTNVLNLLAEQHESTPKSSAATTKRSFVPGSCVIGMAPSNYYRANYANYITDLNITDSSLSFTSGAASGYGVGYVLDGLKPGDSVIFSRDTATYMAVHLTAYKADGTFINYQAMGSVARIVPDEAATVLLVFSASASNSECSITNPMLVLGSTATDYEPYSGTTLPIDWSDSGTIYGGYVDLVKGEVVQEWVKLTYTGQFDMNQLSSHIMATCTRSYFQPSRAELPNIADRLSGYCNMGERKSSGYGASEIGFFFGSATEMNIITGNNLTGIIQGTDDADSAKQKIKAYYAEHPIEICWKISPITYQIDPLTLKTLRSTNNVWSNANGDIDLSYFTHK